VAQAGAEWTLQLRHDAAAKTNLLILIQNTKSGVVTYQASTSAAHPKGNAPTKIALTEKDSRFTGAATFLRSATGKNRKPVKTSGSVTSTGQFDVTCAKVVSA
jgi:hypothetical protein